MRFISEKQRKLFEALAESGEMVFACGPKGISANIVGHFLVRKNQRQDDQLDVKESIDHVHVDWSRVKRVELGDFHGESMLTFFDGSEPLFKFYLMEGSFSPQVIEHIGSLTD